MAPKVLSRNAFTNLFTAVGWVYVQTDIGSDFASLSHGHLLDRGMGHFYIKRDAAERKSGEISLYRC